MKKLKKLLAVALTLSILATFSAVPMLTSSAAKGDDLKFNKNGKFKIVVFSDVQENASDVFGIKRLVEIMEKAIEREKPDLVVFDGDQTEINIKDPEVDFREVLEQILAPVAKANVPYSFVFGNHDNQSAYSGQRTDKDAMLKVYQSIGDCRTVDADPSLTGTGTCKIPIYDSTGANVAFNLFMIDSNTYQNPITGEGGYDNPHKDQLDWVINNADKGVKSLAFQHIPMPEAYNLVKEGTTGETKSYNGKTYVKELVDGVSGRLGEFPCPPHAQNNTGEFNALKEAGVIGLVTGHDHLNSYSGTYNGLTMTAVPGMTYYNYGDEEHRGYGIIELDQEDTSTYKYSTVNFATLNALSSPYAFDVDFSGGNSAEHSNNATAIDNTGLNAKYKLDAELNKTVASFDGTSGCGYKLSDIAKQKMQDGYTYEIMYKLSSAPAGNTDLASGMYSQSGFGTEYASADNRFNYWQSFDGDTQDYRQLYYGEDSKNTDEWIHLVAVWDPDANEGAGQMIGYLNGTQVDTSSPVTKILKFNNNGEFYIGGNSASDGSFRDGTACNIAFVRIHDDIYDAEGVENLCIEANKQGAGASDGTYYPYDEVEYGDLLKNYVPLAKDGTTIPGGNVFTYDAKSPSYSAKFKFRWTVGSDTETGLQFSFDRMNEKEMSYPFGVWVKKPNDNNAGPNGAWHLNPTKPSTLVNMEEKLSKGKFYDIELGRLKVLDNAPEHGGEYYIYLKVNDELVQETYVSVNPDGTYSSGGTPCRLSNEITFCDWGGNGHKIGPTLAPEEYEAYDELSLNDLIHNGTPVNGKELPGGWYNLTYNDTSPTYSAILRYTWIPGGEDKRFTTWFDSSDDYAFCLAAKSPNYSGLGKTAGPNGSWHLVPSNNNSIIDMSSPVVAGQAYDVEFGRLKVKGGPNDGRYYVYFKINDVLIDSYYYDGVKNGIYGNKDVALANKIALAIPEGNIVKATPVKEVYDTYDEVYYSNLKRNGTLIADKVTDIKGGNVFTYDAKSPSYSAILKFRWTAGTETGIQFSFDKSGTNAMSYPFGVWVKKPNDSGAGANGAWHLKPTDGKLSVDMDSPMTEGKTCDVELGRLKVLKGDSSHVGKYYVYLKVDDKLIQETYVEVNPDGTYKSASDDCRISNEIVFADWSAYGNTISEIPFTEEYEEADEITPDDLSKGGNSMKGIDITTAGTYTYDAKSASYSMKFAFRWIPSSARPEFTVFLDDYVYPFCFVAKYPNRSDFGAPAGENGAWHLCPDKASHIVQMESKPVAGEPYDIEIARIKVKSGPHKGHYYVYWTVNGEMIFSYYYDGVKNGTYESTVAVSNKLIINMSEGNAIKTIPNYQISGDFKYVVENDEATIVGLADNAFEGELVIPTEIEGYKVAFIGESAFDSYTGITSVSIPYTIRQIGNGAFAGCTGIITANGICMEDYEDILIGSGNEALLNADWSYSAHNYIYDGTKTKTDTYHTAVCDVCGASKTVAHTGGTATCTEKAECEVCGESYGELAAHNFEYISTGEKTETTHTEKCTGCEATRTVAHTGGTATCTEKAECEVCGKDYGSALGHDFASSYTVDKKATLTANGSKSKHCSRCAEKTSVTTIYYPKTIKLSATTYTYDGKTEKPTVTVNNSKGKAISTSYYTVTYASGRKNVGKYTVKIAFNSKYYSNASKTLTFTIKPKATSISKLTATVGGFKATVKKLTTQTTGYQLQYSTSSKFTSAKTVTISKNTTTSKTVSKLTKGKKYYVRVRTYKTVSGTKYYSSWSSSKYVTTKKK